MTRRPSLSVAYAAALAAVLAVTAPSACAAAACDTLDPCAAKACRLDAEIAEAKLKGNSKLLASLERDRTEVAHCSDDGLRQKRKVALDQAQKRVDQRSADLAKAEATGDAGKIKKAQRRLDSAKKSYDDMKRAPL
jgi:hypothetical protein